MHTVQLPATSAPVPAGPVRRSAAVVVNGVLLAMVVAFSVRSIADVTREQIPPEIDRATACEVLMRGITTTWCDVRGDAVVYSTKSHPVARAVLPPLAVSFGNSVVLTWIAGANVGQLALGLCVRRRDTFGPAGVLRHLLRWPLWPVASFGAVVACAERSPAATRAAGHGDPTAGRPRATFRSGDAAPMRPAPDDLDTPSRPPFPEGS
jgi:hypothetical protein